MRITDFNLIEMKVPLASPIQMSFGLRHERRHLFVEVLTDEGVTGLGETWTNFPFWAVDERKITLESLKRFFVGEDPLNRGEIWSMIDKKILRSDIGLQYGSKGPVYQALSGIDIALWDIAGKAYGKPVYELLGGKLRDSVTAYASGLSSSDYERRVPRLLEEGFSDFKIKVGFSEDSDADTAKAVRSMIGEKSLYADANSKWDSAREALRNIRRLSEYGIGFIEEPVNAARLDDYFLIREAGVVPVAAGENLYGRREYHEYLRRGLVDIIQPDATKCGGITETWAVCEQARLYGAETALHMFGTAVGLAASLQVMFACPQSKRMEYDALDNEMMTELPQKTFYLLKNGSFTISETMPGIGIELDPEYVSRYRV